MGIFVLIVVALIVGTFAFRWLNNKYEDWDENLSEEGRKRIDSFKEYLAKAGWTLCYGFLALDSLFRDERNYWVIAGFLLAGLLPWIYTCYSFISKKLKARKYMHSWEVVDASLKSIGCLVNYYGNVIVANYRGLNFDVHFHSVYPDRLLLRLPAWGKIKQDDTNLETIKDAIKEVNENTHADVVLSEPDEEGDIYLTTNDEVVLSSRLSNHGEYFKSMFHYLHSVSGSLVERYPMLREEDSDNDRPRVGFTTGNE